MLSVRKLCTDAAPMLWGFESISFGHAEFVKFRRRIIIESLLNDLMERDDFERADGSHLCLPTRFDIRASIVAATVAARAMGGDRAFVISLDESACFDQFQLDEPVQRFYRVANGICSAVLTIGLRPA